MIHMKHTKLMAIGTLLLLGVSGAAAQSLGDYARAARKKKVEPTTATRHYDNDNLPTNETLSVVGPPPPAIANAGQGAANASSTPATKAAADPAAAAAERQKTADEWKKKLDQQKQKLDSLNHELDLEQREFRLRAAAYYGDAGTRLRDSAQFDKDDVQYKSDVGGKQKAIDAARQEFDEMQEQARKAGIVEKDKDDASDKK
jgi:phosphopantothenoylcysteine synthetase/decarboxylase